MTNYRNTYRYYKMPAVAQMFPRRRAALVRVLGVIVHPAAVTNAWYAAECPPHSALSDKLPRTVRMRWAVSRFLRGVEL